MLTRLKVSGFKNLVDVDVRFGAFTCVAGANGVGKSNLFDAIRFLSAIADRPLIDAALSVRDEKGRTADVRSLFHRFGDEYANEMSFEAEMIIPAEGVDDLGQQAKASITFLRYSITLAYRSDDSLRSLGSLEIIKEELVPIKLNDAEANLLFNHQSIWRESTVKESEQVSYFLLTEGERKERIINIHSGQKLLFQYKAELLPRTILSIANAREMPTMLLAKREMQSWRLLQLEPSALRQPDEFTSPTKLNMDGSHLAATLYHLARLNKNYSTNELTEDEAESQVYSQVANRLAELINDVDEVKIDRDEKRQLLTLIVTNRDGTAHPARALSDGTLRFLALAVLALDPETQGLLCLEEPENGIHPARIPKILQLLQDIATDVNYPINIDNPLRQVIINTHSPAVVMQIPDDSLLIAELKETVSSGKRFKRVSFGCLPDTWRQKAPEGVNVVPKGKLLDYLNPVVMDESEPNQHRVVDRPDLQFLIPGSPTE
jgi:predicted ATPase